MSGFGKRCRCGKELVAPEWSEFVSEQEVHHLWYCPSCGHQFETAVRIDAKPITEAEIIDRFFPNLLVA